jgi:hypothetical protein
MKINNSLSKAQFLYKQGVVLSYSNKILLGSFSKAIKAIENKKKKYKTSKNSRMFISFYFKHSGKRLNQC